MLSYRCTYIVLVALFKFEILKTPAVRQQICSKELTGTESVNLACLFCQQDLPAILDLVSRARLALQDSPDSRVLLEVLAERVHEVDLALPEFVALPVRFVRQVIRFIIIIIICALQ